MGLQVSGLAGLRIVARKPHHRAEFSRPGMTACGVDETFCLSSGLVNVHGAGWVCTELRFIPFQDGSH